MATFLAASLGNQLPTDLNVPSPFELRRIKGTVVGSDGKLVPAVNVYFVPVDHGGDAFQITSLKTDNEGGFTTTALPHTYLITTDQNVAWGGVNLLRPNILSSYYKLEPGHDLDGVVVRLVPRTDPAAEIRGCGFALTLVALKECLKHAEDQTFIEVQHRFDLILKSASPSRRLRLWKEHQAWIRYRDQTCQLPDSVLSSANITGSSLEKTSCQIRLDRIHLDNLTRR